MLRRVPFKILTWFCAVLFTSISGLVLFASLPVDVAFASSGYSPSGTYTYNSGTLIVNWISSNFPCNGAPLVTEQYTGVTLTSTTMTWLNQNLTWARTSGTADSIVGTWTGTFSGNSYTITFNADGTVSMAGIIISCNGSSSSSSSSANMIILTRKAAAYSMYDLAGTWELNELVSPGPAWDRGPLTIGSDGSFSGTGNSSDGSSGSISGTFGIDTNGIITMPNSSLRCAMDSGKSVAVCANTGKSGDQQMIILTKKALAYSMADLAGTWEMNNLASPGPEWDRGTLTIGPDGSFSTTFSGSDGSTNPASGTFSITTDGIITKQGSSSFRCAMDSGKSVAVCTDTNGSGNTEMSIITKKADSYSMADLAGTWNLNELTSPGPGWDSGVLTIGSDGSLSGNTWGSYGFSFTPNLPTLSIATGGIITATGSDISQSFRCAMDSGKGSMICTETVNYGSPFNLLSISRAGTGSGMVTADSGTIDWSTGTASYSSGTSVVLTATANLGSTFVSWTGCDSTSGNTCTVSMISARSVTATFMLTTYSLTISQAGAGTGTVTSSPAGISCGSTCAASFNPSTSITLTATPATGVNFGGWSGGNCSGTGLTCPFTLNSDTTVTADFRYGSFNDEINNVFAPYIEAIKTAGITTGCGNNDYCPSEDVTRDQMAAFLVRGTQVKAGQSTVNFTCNGGANCATETPYFNDVLPAADSFFPYVQKLKELGITTGCGNGDYCPSENVTRDQMAAFLIRALYGANYTCTGGVAGASVNCGTTTPYFIDVPMTDQFFPYVQKLKELGITTGCGNGNYCPSEDVTRDQMAAFLARAFLGMAPTTTACTTAAVSVAVTDSVTGNAIQGATVRASTQTATTGATGSASFTGLSSDQNKIPITISVTATGYTAQTTTALLACGTTATTSISLVPQSTAGGTVSGTAATGTAIANSTVTLVDKTGKTATGTTGRDGSFSIAGTANLTPPFMLKVTSNSGATSGTTLYSVSADSNSATTINITPLTDMIIRSWYNVQGISMDAAFSNPASSTPPTPAEVSVISSVVIKTIQLWLQQASVPANFNLISSQFTAGTGTGIDSVLDKITIYTSSGNTVNVTVSSNGINQNSAMTATPSGGTVTVTTTTTGSSGTSSSTSTTDVISAVSSYTANGTYTYSSGILTCNWTSSNFPNHCGPQASKTDSFTVTLSSTSMTWVNVSDPINVLTWNGVGTGSSITGTWTMTNSSTGNYYTTTLNQNGTISFAGNIVSCGSGGSSSNLPNGFSNIDLSSQMRTTMGANSGSSGSAINADIGATHGLVSGVPTITGGNIWNNTQMWQMPEIVSTTPPSDHFALLTYPPQLPPVGTTFTFNINTTGGPITYSVPLNAWTTEAITFTNLTDSTINGANLGNTLTMDWTLPKTYAIAEIYLNAQALTGPQGGSSTVECDYNWNLSSVSATSNTISIPATCGNSPVKVVYLNLTVQGIDGEQSFVTYQFGNGQ